jgi:6-phosphogluconolactonase
MTGRPEIRVARDREEWTAAAVALLHQSGVQAVHDHDRFLLALSGGTTPEHLYAALASPDYAGRFDWSKTTFLFGDERCVPPEHPDSNFGLAERVLFRPLRIAPEQIHRMHGEAADPEAAASDYERLLRVISHASPQDRPRLDLVLLGLGHDGHTASLFPGTAAVNELQRLVTVGRSPVGQPTRLTLTLGVINRASVVLFLVTGADKARIVKTVLEPASDSDRRLPAALVRPERGRLIWLLDRPAAAELTIHR